MGNRREDIAEAAECLEMMDGVLDPDTARAAALRIVRDIARANRLPVLDVVVEIAAELCRSQPFVAHLAQAVERHMAERATPARERGRKLYELLRQDGVAARLAPDGRVLVSGRRVDRHRERIAAGRDDLAAYLTETVP